MEVNKRIHLDGISFDFYEDKRAAGLFCAALTS